MKDKTKYFVEIFLQENRSVKDFEHLAFLHDYSSSWIGSAVPMYEGKVAFYESFLPLFNSADLLEHRLIIENQIKYNKEEIERHKKRDFVGHY